MLISTKRITGVAAVALSLALAVSGCGKGSGDSGDGGSGSSSSKEVSVTFIPKNLGNPYFDTSDAGGNKAVTEFGGKYAQVGPPEGGGPDAQAQYIDTEAQKHTSAIVVSANDPKALCDSLNQAKDAGTKAVTFHSDTDPSCRDVFVNQASTDGIAKVQVDMIAEQVGDAGEIAILSASANATNQNAWIETMKTELENHPNIKLVDTVYGNDDDQTSFDKTAALLQSHPNLKGIIAPTTVGIAAAARYISTSDYKGKVAVTGLGTPNQMRAYVEDGTVTEFALWNPEDLGTLAAWAAKALVDGDITGKEGDTFEAGDLGKFTVGEDATVLLGEPYRFNKDNIGDFDF